MDALVHLFIYLLVLGCIIGLLLYLVNISPIPEPFKTWLWFVVVAIAVILPLAGSPPNFKFGR